MDLFFQIYSLVFYCNVIYKNTDVLATEHRHDSTLSIHIPSDARPGAREFCVFCCAICIRKEYRDILQDTKFDSL